MHKLWRVAAVLIIAGACSSGGPKRLVLDGRPRVPDAEGVVQKVSVTSITLDGGRTYKVSPQLQSFATQTMQTVPLLQRKGQYVHVGLDGKTMVWIAAVGAVLTTTPPTVYYTGTLTGASATTATFRDGTVLRLGSGVKAPVTKGFVQVRIDPVRHVVAGMALP